MPLTKKGKKIMRAMKKEYGPKKGESVFYASRNKGTVKGVEKGKSARRSSRKNFSAGNYEKMRRKVFGIPKDV